MGWKAFIAAVLGGIGEIGELLLGASARFVEIFVAAVFPSTLRDLIAFSILLIFLSIKPTGIFGVAGPQKFRLYFSMRRYTSVFSYIVICVLGRCRYKADFWTPISRSS